MMMQLFIAAFALGVLGSFHCVGMCGPLALALPLNSNSTEAKLRGALIYNAGRIITYAVFGLLFGLLGQTAALFGVQQWLSIGAGTLILFFLLMPGKYRIQNRAAGYTGRVFNRIRTALGHLFTQEGNKSLLVIGLLNGLLPCGLVYMAIAGAIGTGNITNAMWFMAAFGLGTLPVMWSVAFFGNFIGLKLRQQIRKIYPYMMALMASLLILRGMGLGIPYVSPRMEANTKEVVGCCAKPDENHVFK